MPVNCWGLVIMYDPASGKILHAVDNAMFNLYETNSNIVLSFLEVDERGLENNSITTLNLPLREAIKRDVRGGDYNKNLSVRDRKFSVQDAQLYDNEAEQVVTHDTNPEKAAMKGSSVQALTDLDTIITNAETLTDAQVRDAIKKMARHQEKMIKRLIQAK